MLVGVLCRQLGGGGLGPEVVAAGRRWLGTLAVALGEDSGRERLCSQG